MRPVEKGVTSYLKISSYQEAEPYLQERIGRYCSFCEFPITHVPEVEHREGKHSGGSMTDWENLLYGCKYCNTRKAQKIKKGEADRWLWPDRNNTFLAYTYVHGIPKINEKYLKEISESVFEKAKALFDGVGLGNIPQKMGDKDKRWIKRLETFGIAEDCRTAWLKMKQSQYREIELKQIIVMAKATGFFSVWMSVFSDEPEVKKTLIYEFPGTSLACFDENGTAVRRAGSEL